MTISELVTRAHDNAVKHGFWNPAPAFGTSIALIHSELSEALEEELPAGRTSGSTVWKGTRPFPVIRPTKPTVFSSATKTGVSTGGRSPKAWPWNWPTP